MSEPNEKVPNNKTTPSENSDTLFERYKILVEARNFHYDNFSKWASYFYVAIGALFVAYYSIVGSDKIEEKELLTYVVLVLGYALSMLWYWSTKGYYFWNINFISLVNYYEIEVLKWKKEERIYSILANKNMQNSYSNPVSGANISTSKIAIFFAYLVTLTWGTLAYNKLFDALNLNSSFFILFLLSFLLSVFTIVLLSITVGKLAFFSKIDHMYDLNYRQDKN